MRPLSAFNASASALGHVPANWTVRSMRPASFLTVSTNGFFLWHTKPENGVRPGRETRLTTWPRSRNGVLGVTILSRWLCQSSVFLGDWRNAVVIPYNADSSRDEYKTLGWASTRPTKGISNAALLWSAKPEAALERIVYSYKSLVMLVSLTMPGY